MDKKVFISKGSAATDEQRQFVDAILDMLKTAGLSPRIMNENEWSHEQPLKAIKKIISQCDGIVLIAFTRTIIENGSEVKKDSKNDLKNILLPTPWNHIEGAIAYTMGMPLLVIAENGLKSEGLIENGYDWRVYWTDLNPDIVKTDSFRGFLASWKDAMDTYNSKKRLDEEHSFDIEKLTIGRMLKCITVSQLWAIASAILGLIITISTIAYKIGGGKWPWDN